MMKKILSTTTALMLTSSLYAFDWNSQSLVGLEFGYGNMNIKGNDTSYNKDVSPLTYGIKIGAKNRSARLFLSARYLAIPNFDKSLAIGAELQYLKAVSKPLDLFIGVNAGMITMSFDPSSFDDKATSNNRDVMDYYGGLDAGINLNFNESFTLELGARYMYMDISHKKDNETYTVGPLTQAYMSFIYSYYASK